MEIITLEEKYRKAFTDVYVIINQMTEENKSRISKSFINFIDENRSDKTISEANYNYKLINSKKLTRETKVILSLIYRTYFCNEDEKNKQLTKDAEAINNMYKYDNLFNKTKKNEKAEENIACKELMPIQKKNFLFRAIDNILQNLKKFFKR